MFVDARRLDNDATIEADVCIIGGGVAGITLALEFGKRGIRTCVLESGGFRPDPATRDLNRGENVGLPYRFDDGCRSRFLGGSSNCWGGWCRPMDEQDFAARDWVPYSGWPFPKRELVPYYDRSRDVLQIGPDRYDPEFWVAASGRTDVRRMPFVTGDVIDAISQFSPPLKFGRFYEAALRRAQHLTVFLYANATEIETDASGCRVQAVKLATLTGRTAWAKAMVFILAAGGIENPRLLLASNRTHPAGLGNQNDLVGRFFMDHVQLSTGQVRLVNIGKQDELYDCKFNHNNPAISAYGTRFAAQLMLSPDVQAREKLLNALVSLEFDLSWGDIGSGPSPGPVEASGPAAKGAGAQQHRARLVDAACSPATLRRVRRQPLPAVAILGLRRPISPPHRAGPRSGKPDHVIGTERQAWDEPGQGALAPWLVGEANCRSDLLSDRTRTLSRRGGRGLARSGDRRQRVARWLLRRRHLAPYGDDADA